MAQRLGHPPLRLPRSLRAVGRRAGTRSAARGLPPRRRLLGHGGARRPLGRHDDGLQPARRRADGDALGIDRRRDRAAPAAYEEARARGDRAGARVGFRPARALRGDRPGRGARALALRPKRRLRCACSHIASRHPLRRWPPRSTGSTRLSSPPGSAKARRAFAATSARGFGFLGVELDDEANAHAVPDVDVNAQRAALRVVVLHAREDVIAARAAVALLR